MAIQDEMYKAIEKEINQTVESGTEKITVNFEKAKGVRVMAKNNIFLIGFMGTGKTTVSRRLGALLRYRELDMDQELERREGMKISEMFEKKGEAYFRALETALLEELRQASECLVSCGGGAALREENVERMKESGAVVLLTASPETVLKRVRGGGDRPLLNGNMNLSYIADLMERRAPFYRAAADITVTTDGRDPGEIAEEIRERLGLEPAKSGEK